jgi:predicted nucleic acid-binding protein
VAGRLILETSFLIDLEREARRSAPGVAHGFLARHEGDSFYATVTVAGELAAGASLASRAAWEEFLAPLQILAIDREAAWEYGRAYRYLEANGLLIGSNDLWIAATALAHRMPLVTRNPAHFSRVPGLEVLSYGE